MAKIKLNSKSILIIIVVVSLILAMISFVSSQKNTELLPSSLTGKTTISDVVVNNFEAHPILKNDSGDSLIEEEQDFQITFVKQFNQFFITVMSPNFNQVRPQAEQAFLKQLGVSQEDACKLSVTINTPRFINPDLSGQSFPLSFCQ